jgi:pyruvate/2-oxoglutarate dehydrogenase complex dihydrolipoamide dehydrogenase (E3) component
MYDYDVIVIGAGSAGLVAAKLAAGLGKKTALIEKSKIGGDCTWFGCVPSKALIRSAQVVHETRNIERFGIKLKSQLQLNPENVMAHVRAVRQADYEAHSLDSFKKEGIDLIFGPAKFIDEHLIVIDGRKLSSNKFIICAGSHPAVPQIEGFSEVPYLTNESIFELERLPGSMLILGGGPIGTEMASALNRLGVKITIIQRAPALLANDDPELVSMLMDYLRAEGVNILVKCSPSRLYKENGLIAAEAIDDENRMTKISAEAMLVAVGRAPNVDNLDLHNAGVEFDKRGLKVDKYLRTTAPNIYGAGDVVPPYLFTHVAEHEAVIATRNACLPIKSRPDYDNVLWCTFTDPPLAHAGLTESQAREQYGDDVSVYKWKFSDVDRAKTDLATEGFVKVVCRKKGRILGIHILGAHAEELMHEVQLAKLLGRPFSKIAKMIHAYPSYSDAIRQPAKKCYIDLIQNNIFIKLLSKFRTKKRK